MHRRFGRRLLVLVAASVTVTVAVPAAAITGGQPDGTHYFAVALISSAGRPSCSGVWTDIGSHRRVVVTDAHCVPAPAASRVRVFFGKAWSAGGRTYSGRSYRHPSYDARTHRNDVAVIKLDTDPGRSPAVLARAGAATSLQHVVTVGYGSPHTGQRRSATEIVRSWSSWRLFLRAGTGNSCAGDSGGPDLVPGTRQVVALTDDGTCSWDADTRVDTGSARSFILGPH